MNKYINLSPLNSVLVPGLANYQDKYFFSDSPTNVKIKKSIFYQYPVEFDYQFNSRGFRDDEWPDSGLENVIWCVGDSQTTAIGCPIECAWPNVLSGIVGIKNIKISLGGASNDWICRKSIAICNEIQPRYLVVNWGFINRRETDWKSYARHTWQDFYKAVKDPTWPQCDHIENIQDLPLSVLAELKTHDGWLAWDQSDLAWWDVQLQIQSMNTSYDADVAHLLGLIKKLENAAKNTTIIHSFNMMFSPFEKMNDILDQAAKITPLIPELQEIVDGARDQCHYGIKTHSKIAESIADVFKTSRHHCSFDPTANK